MASTEIRDRRRTLRYRHLLVRQMVQMKNRISGLLMETGVSHNKQRLHKVGYFRELISNNEEVHENIRPLLRAEPGDDRTVPENGIRSGEFSAAGSVAGREAQAPQNRSRSRTHHRADLGAGDRGCIALPVGEASDQLLRTVRRGKEFRRQGPANTAFQAAQQTYPAVYWSKPRNWLPDRATSWL